MLKIKENYFNRKENLLNSRVYTERPKIVRAMRMEQDFEVVSHGSKTIGRAGNYLVQFSDHSLYVYPEDIFRKFFIEEGGN